MNECTVWMTPVQRKTTPIFFPNFGIILCKGNILQNYIMPIAVEIGRLKVAHVMIYLSTKCVLDTIKDFLEQCNFLVFITVKLHLHVIWPKFKYPFLLSPSFISVISQ